MTGDVFLIALVAFMVGGFCGAFAVALIAGGNRGSE